MNAVRCSVFIKSNWRASEMAHQGKAFTAGLRLCLNPCYKYSSSHSVVWGVNPNISFESSEKLMYNPFKRTNTLLSKS